MAAKPKLGSVKKQKETVLKPQANSAIPKAKKMSQLAKVGKRRS